MLVLSQPLLRRKLARRRLSHCRRSGMEEIYFGPTGAA
ncbi:hypothetical protein SAMCFNEI73_Ch0240 [Sinorhizobium americanum]|uniref:Uncharacterized protein n=1 Tax=Sinorhizobium americanum TaxID=194963 RepID=A0A1L3LHI7_9HYPH|nr:hypothetical protein SAMCCGM7_Ch0242 [Sinorhizobium americanum CCGM7]APG89574.1 hypothetical protein SAMCFNEI73_Ch0240 [Sinorhizobium americanum]